MDGDLRKYVDLRIEDLKRRVSGAISAGTGGFILLIVGLVMASISLIALALGIMLLLGDLVGNWTVAAFITGGIFLLLMSVTLLLARRLILNVSVRLERRQAAPLDAESLLLLCIRSLRSRISGTSSR